MSFEDQNLTCVQCNNEFVFSAGEQEFHAEKGFTNPPKRCKDCRKELKARKGRPNSGDYRSPSFGGAKSGRGRGPQKKGEYRSPMDRGHNAARQSNDYRSPAFRDRDQVNPNDEYRSPGFQEQAGIVPEEEYRSPGFREYDDINPAEEYRSPGFQTDIKGHKDQKPLFEIVCDSCGETKMVPFLPEEKESPLCQECFRAQRQAEREQAEAATAEEDSVELDSGPDNLMTPEITEPSDEEKPSDD